VVRAWRAWRWVRERAKAPHCRISSQPQLRSGPGHSRHVLPVDGELVLLGADRAPQPHLLAVNLRVCVVGCVWWGVWWWWCVCVGGGGDARREVGVARWRRGPCAGTLPAGASAACAHRERATTRPRHAPGSGHPSCRSPAPRRPTPRRAQRPPASPPRHRCAGAHVSQRRVCASRAAAAACCVPAANQELRARHARAAASAAPPGRRRHRHRSAQTGCLRARVSMVWCHAVHARRQALGAGN
jgi:hypothetical protein